MSDFKSKLPDFNELSSMAGKLFKDLKTSVNEIIDDYKKKHQDISTESKTNSEAEVKPPVPPVSDTPKPDEPTPKPNKQKK